MKKIILLCFLMTVCFLLSGQTKTEVIKVQVESPMYLSGFRCVGIIDKRVKKENLGFVLGGLMNRPKRLVFPVSFDQYFPFLVNKFFIKEANTRELVILVHSFHIYERVTNNFNYAYCVVDIEFAEYEGSSLFSLGRFDYEIDKPTGALTMSTQNRFYTCLNKCIFQFYRSDWKNGAGKIIKKEAIEATTEVYDYKRLPPKGFYKSFKTLERGEPMRGVGFNIQKKDPVSLLLRFKLEGKEKDFQVSFVSDGVDFYMHSRKYRQLDYYLKSILNGRYIYFEDRIPTGGAGAFGLAGVAASNTIKAIVLDTQTGEISILNNKSLYSLTKEYPEIWASYNKGNRMIKDKRNAIAKLNSKFE